MWITLRTKQYKTPITDALSNLQLSLYTFPINAVNHWSKIVLTLFLLNRVFIPRLCDLVCTKNNLDPDRIIDRSLEGEEVSKHCVIVSLTQRVATRYLSTQRIRIYLRQLNYQIKTNCEQF